MHVYRTDPSDLRETSEPRSDRIPPARPAWRARQYRELKKNIFLAPSKCRIDLFGPSANGTILKRLHVAFVSLASVLQYASSTFLQQLFLGALRYANVTLIVCGAGAHSSSSRCQLLARRSTQHCAAPASRFLQQARNSTLADASCAPSSSRAEHQRRRPSSASACNGPSRRRPRRRPRARAAPR